MEADFTVQNCGTVWQFLPVSAAAYDFSHAELGLEPWQWMGASFVIDHRPAAALAQQLSDEGWTLRAA